MTPGWWQRVFPGDPRQLATVRRHVGDLLTDCPDLHSVVTCAAELAANAIEHTRSGNGGTFVVHVQRAARAIRVAVMDAGAPTWPTIRAARDDSLSEGGRGLAIVAGLSDRMGIEGDENGRTVWAEFHRLEEDPPCWGSVAEGGSPSPVELGAWPDSWVCWFGNHTRQWWAIPRQPEPLLIAAASAQDLANKIAIIERDGP